MGSREPGLPAFQKRGEGMGLAGAKITLPDFEQLLDFTYVNWLSGHALAQKLDRVRALLLQQTATEVQGLLPVMRINLLRALFLKRTEGLLPDLQLMEDVQYLRGYSSEQLEKLLIALELILGKTDLDLDLRVMVIRARGNILRISAPELWQTLQEE